MTCYFRQLQPVFKKAGIVVTSENKREIDKMIHSIVGTEYKNCSVTWKLVKQKIAENEDDFISMMKENWTKKGVQ
jgi:hypothetical protein